MPGLHFPVFTTTTAVPHQSGAGRSDLVCGIAAPGRRHAPTTTAAQPHNRRRDAMSYLLQYARRPDSITPRRPAARVDEYVRLNRPGLYGDAYVRVFVEDTTARRRRRGADPQLVLQIADCANVINLEFSLKTAQLRKNSLFKVNTLLGALHRFRDGLAAEAELARQRQRR
jgi:hypothetical protein